MSFEWFEPWWSTDDKDDHFFKTFLGELEHELSPGDVLFEIPVNLIAHGNGDDALFEFKAFHGSACRVSALLT